MVLTGCVPYVVPPVTGTVGATRSTERASRTGVHVDVGFSPVQLVESQLHRTWDATISGSFDRDNDNEWGAALAAGPILHPWGKRDSERTSRVLPQLVGRWTTEGRAVALRVAVERAAFATGDDKSEEGGFAWGEIGFGLYVEAARVWPDEMDDHYVVTAGLTVRLPFLAGVACCVKYR